jgi:prophage regulatory protein
MQLLNRRQVAERTGLSVSSIKRLEAQGRFPRRVPISENRVGWLLSEIESWIGAKVSERDQLDRAVAEPERARELAREAGTR